MEAQISKEINLDKFLLHLMCDNYQVFISLVHKTLPEARWLWYQSPPSPHGRTDYCSRFLSDFPIFVKTKYTHKRCIGFIIKEWCDGNSNLCGEGKDSCAWHGIWSNADAVGTREIQGLLFLLDWFYVLRFVWWEKLLQCIALTLTINLCVGNRKKIMASFT